MPEPSWIPGSVAERRPWRRSRARGSRASPYLLHSRCTPIKDNRETLQPETDHRRESRTAVHASNGVWDRIITLQTHNHERERERAGNPAACLLFELARACWRIEVRDAWNCGRRERGDFLWLQLQQGSGLLSRPVPRDVLYGSCSKKKLFSLSLPITALS
jgi:hypothetical protein